MKIAVIGAGWYGVHIAITLSEKGHDVTLFEKNPNIFMGISAKFGGRLHSGLHYPRSPATRDSCYRAFFRFILMYSDLVDNNIESVYGIGTKDGDNLPSKVTSEQFENVMQEVKEHGIDCQKIEASKSGINPAVLMLVALISEPGLALGETLRDKMEARLKNSTVKQQLRTMVTSINRDSNFQFNIDTNLGSFNHIDKVVNATSYQSLLPASFVEKPLGIEVLYQACIAFVYKENKISTVNQKALSFIVMDGKFPCLMPLNNEPLPARREYALMHCGYTTLCSSKSPEDAREVLNEFIIDHASQAKLRLLCEAAISQFIDDFDSKFEYCRLQATVFARVRNHKESRGSITFEYKDDGVIYVIPGKVSNVFDASDEISELIGENKKSLVCNGSYTYTKDSILATAMNELTESPELYPGQPDITRNACDSSAYSQLKESGMSLFGQSFSSKASINSMIAEEQSLPLVAKI